MNRSAHPLPSGARMKAGEDAMPSHRILALEVVGHVLGPVIVPQAQPCGDVLADSAKTSRHTSLH